MCPSTDLKQAIAKAERLRLAICDATLCDVQKLKVTVSFGVTEIEPGDTPNDIFGRADNALLLKQVDQLGSFAVADPQPALEQRGRGALMLLDQLDRRRQQLILVIRAQKLGWPL